MGFIGKNKEKLNFIVQILIIAASLFLLFFLKQHAFAADDGFAIIGAGEDRTGQLGNIASIIKTLQLVSFKWIAWLVGGCIVGYGVWQVAFVRNALPGTIAIICGASMFFLQKIIESLSKLAG